MVEQAWCDDAIRYGESDLVRWETLRTSGRKRLHCHECGAEVLADELLSTEIIPGHRWGLYCLSCVREAPICYARGCVLCGSEYLHPDGKSDRWLCPQCYSEDRARQARIVAQQCYRTLAQRGKADLTLLQWLKTLAVFRGRCAYCVRGEAEVLEHMQPLSGGGSTTASNCVPACRACNSRKGRRVGGAWPGPVVIERIVQLLNQVHGL